MGNLRAWSQELSVYATLSFGAGLAAYGGAIKKHISPSGDFTIWIAMGVAVAIIGLRLQSTLPSERIRPPLWLRALAILTPLVVGAAAIAALAPTVRSTIEHLGLHDRELQGLTIALPAGDETPNAEQAARLRISDIGGLDLVVSVVWQIGTFDDGSARGIAETGARSAQLSARVLLPDTTLIVGGGIPHRTFRIAAESHDIFITVLPCGRRIYSVFTFGDGALELLRRMMTSLRCNADTHAVPPVPAIVDLPDGWKPTDAEPGQLAYRRDSEVLVVVALDILSEGMLQGAMESTVRQIGANARLDSRREITTPNGIRTVWIGAVAGGDTTVPIHLSALTCREQRVTLGIMHIGGIDETRSVELFGRVRCADTPPAGPAAK